MLYDRRDIDSISVDSLRSGARLGILNVERLCSDFQLAKALECRIEQLVLGIEKLSTKLDMLKIRLVNPDGTFDHDGFLISSDIVPNELV